MRAWTLAVKRSLSQAALLSSIAIVVAVVTGFLVGGASYLDVASDRVLRSDLAAAAPVPPHSSSNLRRRTTLAARRAGPITCCDALSPEFQRESRERWNPRRSRQRATAHRSGMRPPPPCSSSSRLTRACSRMRA